MYAWGKKGKMLVFTGVYVCVKAKLTLFSFFPCFFCTFFLKITFSEESIAWKPPSKMAQQGIVQCKEALSSELSVCLIHLKKFSLSPTQQSLDVLQCYNSGSIILLRHIINANHGNKRQPTQCTRQSNKLEDEW